MGQQHSLVVSEAAAYLALHSAHVGCPPLPPCPPLSSYHDLSGRPKHLWGVFKKMTSKK